MKRGDSREVLPTLASDSVHCVVTSPPYYGLRDYGTALWAGGDVLCDHTGTRLVSPNSTLRRDGREHLGPYDDEKAVSAGMPYRDICGRCGARRVDRQIGLEATADEYLATMVAVFREVRRVLRPDGTCWVNVGDSYAASRAYQVPDSKHRDVGNNGASSVPIGYKPKDLLLLPARLALALQADGWWVRSDIIISKRNPMPESVTDRCTSAHEHLFMLTKAARYYFDAEGIKETVTGNAHPRGNGLHPKAAEPGLGIKQNGSFSTAVNELVTSRNPRNVWEISTFAYKGAHFATFSPELPERCIRAGTSERGCCAACGKPWVRQTTSALYSSTYGDSRRVDVPGSNDGKGNEDAGARGFAERMRKETTTTGWAAACQCEAATVPCVVLDPFAGSGTTLLVADRLQRDAIGIELSAPYSAMAETRIEADAPLFAWADAQPAMLAAAD